MWDCLGTNLPILPFHMLCPPGLTFGKWSASLQQERKGQAPGKPKKFNHFILRAEESSRQRQKSSVQQQQTNFCYWWEHQGQVETIPQEIMSSSNYKRQRERKATLLHIVYLLSCLSWYLLDIYGSSDKLHPVHSILQWPFCRYRRKRREYAYSSSWPFFSFYFVIFFVLYSWVIYSSKREKIYLLVY